MSKDLQDGVLEAISIQALGQVSISLKNVNGNGSLISDIN